MAEIIIIMLLIVLIFASDAILCHLYNKIEMLNMKIDKILKDKAGE